MRACEGPNACGAWSETWRFYTGSGQVSRYYYVTDHLGSVRATVNANGEVVQHDDYYPFGMQMPQRSMETPEAPKERYTGHELDTEIGVYYAGARYLDPVIGRWNAVDPLAEKYPGWSPYNYVLNNPIRRFDPDGKYPCPPCLPVQQIARTYVNVRNTVDEFGSRFTSDRNFAAGMTDAARTAAQSVKIEGTTWIGLRVDAEVFSGGIASYEYSMAADGTGIATEFGGRLVHGGVDIGVANLEIGGTEMNFEDGTYREGYINAGLLGGEMITGQLGGNGYETEVGLSPDAGGIAMDFGTGAGVGGNVKVEAKPANVFISLYQAGQTYLRSILEESNIPFLQGRSNE